MALVYIVMSGSRETVSVGGYDDAEDGEYVDRTFDRDRVVAVFNNEDDAINFMIEESKRRVAELREECGYQMFTRECKRLYIRPDQPVFYAIYDRINCDGQMGDGLYMKCILIDVQ